MTLQELLMEHSEDTVIDAGGIEWGGYDLEQEYLSQNEEILSMDAFVDGSGRIWLITEEGNRRETGYTII